MGKKKKASDSDDVYCWYCERKFEDEKVLVAHQKAKHFKCHICHRKLSTAGGMVVHVYQVHKETIAKVPNSKPGRDSVKYEIYGMEGIPDGDEDDNPAKKLKTDSTPLLPTPGSVPGFPGAVPPYMQPGYTQQWGFAQQAPPPQSGATITSPPMAAPRPAPLFPIQPGLPPPMPVMPGLPQTATFASGPSHHAHGGPPSPTSFSFAGTSMHGAPPHAIQSLATQHVPLPLPNQTLPPNLAPQQLNAQPPNTYLVYDDENNSMEEKRAEHPRYRYDEERIKQQMNKLDQSIEFRVSQIGSRIGL